MFFSRLVVTPSVAILVSLLYYCPYSAHGHGYLKTPRSRNFVAFEDGVWFGGGASTPAKEVEPQSANRGGTLAQCGIIAGRNYDTPTNYFGDSLAPNPQTFYQCGQIIDLDVTLTAHHKGHFEFKACPISPGQVATQDCFDANPLMFISDTKYGANFDTNYPERAYIPDASGYSFSYKFQLPAGLSGDLVLLQWHYVTANSCIPTGYNDYNWPTGSYWPGANPQNLPTCGPLPPDGNGAPEQFWNCAEISIANNNCAGSPSLPPVTLVPTSIPTSSKPTGTNQVITTGPTAKPTSSAPTTTTTTAISTVAPPLNPLCSPETNQCGPSKTCAQSGFPDYCCSQYGWCGPVDVLAPNGGAYCGACCQNGPCTNAPSPPSPTPPSPTIPSPSPPTPLPPTGVNYNANHGEDSRLIAYVGNWQTCPTAEQFDAYSHVVIAFAVTYTWSPSKNNCDVQCSIASTVPICNNMNDQVLINTLRAAGKKVILSFGGAGMGGSWDGDQNNCWDYCFGKEDQLATNLVTIINDQNFDGIDLDYEYCYDIADKQIGRCQQRSSLYTDVKAQTFLNDMTSKLRQKLDALQLTNGYNRGRYEVTHAPMDSDLTPNTSKYFQILKARRADLDFLMPQFYNGVTRPQTDGIGGSGAGAMSAAVLFSSLADDMFNMQPNKVVFGFCISDCGSTGSNANAAQAVKIMTDLKTYNNGQYLCNGGAFFWVAAHDNGGVWSDAVIAEVRKTAGCSSGPLTTFSPTPVTTSPTYLPTLSNQVTANPTATAQPTSIPSSQLTTLKPTFTPTSQPMTSKPTSIPTVKPTAKPSLSALSSKPTSSKPTTRKPTLKPTTRQPTLKPTSSKPSSKPTTPRPATPLPTSFKPTSTTSELVISTVNRCGTSEIDARENCRSTCINDTTCPSGMICHSVNINYCGSIPQRTYTNPIISSVVYRCGTSEIHARTFCGIACSWDFQCGSGEICHGVHPNYCGSAYTV